MDTNINEKARGQGTRKEEKQEMENIYLWKGQGRGEQNREIKDMWNDEKRLLNKIGNMQHKKTKNRNMINEKAKEKGSGKDKKDLKNRKNTSDKEREKGNRKWQIK